MHIDFHGKLNRKDNLNMDVGSIAYYYEHWDTTHKFYNKLIKCVKNEMKRSICNNVTYVTKYGNFKFDVDMDPFLCGCWADGQQTMVQQGVKLGIPSLQIEMPLKMRKELVGNRRLIENLAESLVNIYGEIKKNW